MMRLHLKKQIYTVGGYMLDNIIYTLLYNPIVWIVVFWLVLYVYSMWYHKKHYGKMNNKIVDLGSKSKIDDDYIKDLEHDIDMLATMVLDLRKENKKLKKELKNVR